MGGPKPQQLPYQQNNVVEYKAPPDTPDMQALRSYQPNTDLLAPALKYQLGNANNEVDQQFDTPYSGFTDPYAKARMKAILKGQNLDSYNRNLAQGQYDVNQQQLQKLQSSATLSRPEAFTTQSYGYGTQMPQSNGMGAAALSGGAALAGTIITVAA